MAYGIELYNASGDVQVSSEDLLTRLIDVFHVGKDESGTKTIAGFEASRGGAIALPAEDMGVAIVHEVTTVGSDVTYEPMPDDSTYRVASFIWVFHYK